MKFFGRQNEIKELQEIRNLSLQTARFTIVTGRRRSGKTSLLIKHTRMFRICCISLLQENQKQNSAEILSKR